MASAQALPSSRKQEHLEAGKRRLEEFRKKKAAERAKKAGPTGQPHALDVSLDQRQLSETEHARLTDSDGVSTSDGPGRPAEPIGASRNNGNRIYIAEQSSLKDADRCPPSSSDYSTLFSGITQKHTNNFDSNRHDASGLAGSANVMYGQETEKVNNDSGIYTGSQEDRSSSNHSIVSGLYSSSSQSSLYGRELFQSKENNISLKHSLVNNDSNHFLTSYPSSASSEQQTFKPSYSSSPAIVVDSTLANMKLRDSDSEVEQDMHFNYPMNSAFGERNFSSSSGSLHTVHDTAVQTSESTGFNPNARIPPSHVTPNSVTSESNTKRSRPSFLDSLNVSRSSSRSSFQRTEPEESFIIHTSNSNGIDAVGSSAFQKLPVETKTDRSLSEMAPSNMPSSFDSATKFPVSLTNGVGIMNSNTNENIMERKHEFYQPKQNDDFSSLEQHIEDLTQEKFSLQRALEASRALAESLAAENSSLTDSYNQQRGVVNQLKSDMEQLQEDIKTHLVELESVKIAFSNAHLECNAADERAKLLASEVISLEEKALRLRSSELKLGRQLENSQAEITSYKKKMSSLEKDRQDLQSTIDALQEEKKLLQSKLRKAFVTEKSPGVSRSAEKKNVATSTEDLDDIPETSSQETHGTSSVPRSDATDVLMLPENDQSVLEASSVYIPSDQMRMIQNINTILSELALEKEELMHALTSESSQCSKLKDLNNELSRKLEVQTQRLELLTAQSMANENIPTRLPNSDTVQDSNTYADEGDEDHPDEEQASVFDTRQDHSSNQENTCASSISAAPLVLASSTEVLSLPIISSSSSPSNSNSSKKSSAKVTREDWRQRSKPIPPGGTYPAKDHCSQCGLCDTYYIAHVKNACAFLGDGMSKIEGLEPVVHGRGRKVDSSDETYFGVHEELLYARKTKPVEGAQWTGIVTTIAIEMLKSGMVEAVICVQSDPEDRFSPRPVLARTPDEVLAAKGVKPTLSPNLNTLALVEAAGVKRLLFCGVGCQVQALRSVEHHLNLDKLYVLGTNCVDNGTREGLDKFLKAASDEPETVLHYEFMQDYKVHLKHLDGRIEEDLVVGYMGVPKYPGVSMTQHPQYITVRNERGREMIGLVKDLLEITPTINSGDRRPFVMETVKADDNAKLGKGPSQPAPKFIGNFIAFLLNLIGPKGLEFARYSLDYHTIRNYLYTNRTWGKERADRHTPSYAKKLVKSYNKNGQIDLMLQNKETVLANPELKRRGKDLAAHGWRSCGLN
uniref:Coenzyme F420 hydrogenase/dehydrogenase beta subunit N-terminal domain-containing protein n=1 Tax=Salix viminalis TaxID=40686 RepID=A0A6N2N7W3_SALVM